MSKIFISYRRDDSADVCGRITDHLIERFGKNAIFKDVDSLHGGEQFPARLHAALQQCDVALVVIGRQWLTISDATGRRRLDDPGDFVRYEVEQLLQRGIVVLPVLVQQASMPRTDELPPALAALATHPPLTVRPDPYFRQDAQALAGTVGGILRAAARKRQRLIPHPLLLMAAVMGLIATTAALLASPAQHAAVASIFGPIFFVTYVFVLFGAPFQAILHKQRAWLGLLLVVFAASLAVAGLVQGDTRSEAISEIAAFALVIVYSVFGQRLSLWSGIRT